MSDEERGARREIEQTVRSRDLVGGLRNLEPRFTWLGEEVSAVQFLAALRGESYVVIPTHRDPTIDSPYLHDDFGYDVTPYVGYVDTMQLGVYHPPFQSLAPHAPTSARRSTMGTTDDGNTQDQDTTGQNTGSQAEGSNAGSATLPPAADDQGEGSETGASSSTQETQGVSADDVAKE